MAKKIFLGLSIGLFVLFAISFANNIALAQESCSSINAGKGWDCGKLNVDPSECSNYYYSGRSVRPGGPYDENSWRQYFQGYYIDGKPKGLFWDLSKCTIGPTDCYGQCRPATENMGSTCSGTQVDSCNNLTIDRLEGNQTNCNNYYTHDSWADAPAMSKCAKNSNYIPACDLNNSSYNPDCDPDSGIWECSWDGYNPDICPCSYCNKVGSETRPCEQSSARCAGKPCYYEVAGGKVIQATLCGSEQPVCGNGVVEQGEQCDPPDMGANPPGKGYGCWPPAGLDDGSAAWDLKKNLECKYQYCGDGEINDTEECDPGTNSQAKPVWPYIPAADNPNCSGDGLTGRCYGSATILPSGVGLPDPEGVVPPECDPFSASYDPSADCSNKYCTCEPKPPIPPLPCNVDYCTSQGLPGALDAKCAEPPGPVANDFNPNFVIDYANKLQTGEIDINKSLAILDNYILNLIK